MRTNLRIEEHNGYNHLKIETDDYEKIEDAIAEVCNDTWYDPRNRKKLSSALERFFDNHSDFYDAIGFEASKKHGATGKNFARGGFRKFVRDFFDDGTGRINYVNDEQRLQMVCDAIAERLGEIISEFEETATDEGYVARSQISLDTEQGGQKLRDPEMLDEAVLVAKDSAHKIKVERVEDTNSLDDIEDEVRESMRGVYETQVDARVGTLKNRIKTLESKIEEERQEMMVKGIEMIGEMDEWVVEDTEYGTRLVYQKKVVPKEVTKRYNDENPKKLTVEAKEKFYIEGLMIPIEPNVSNAKFRDAYHPNALHGTKTCTGNFSAPLEEALDKIVQQMEQINLHSHDNNSAETEFKENFDEYVKEGEETEEVWTN